MNNSLAWLGGICTAVWPDCLLYIDRLYVPGMGKVSIYHFIRNDELEINISSRSSPNAIINGEPVKS